MPVTVTLCYCIQVPQQPTQLVHDVYFCHSTGQYLPSSDFELSSEAKYACTHLLNAHLSEYISCDRTMGRSRRAGHVDNVARRRQDDSIYRTMLKQIRTSEEKYGDGSRVVFLLQVINLYQICIFNSSFKHQCLRHTFPDLF